MQSILWHKLVLLCDRAHSRLLVASVKQPRCLKVSGRPVNADGSEKHHASAGCQVKGRNVNQSPVLCVGHVCESGRLNNTDVSSKHPPAAFSEPNPNGADFTFYLRRLRAEQIK